MTTERDAQSSPPPCGAGAGGGGRSEYDAATSDMRDHIPIPDSADPREGLASWGPAFGKTRQTEFVRANLRAKRLRREMTPSEKKLWKLLREESGAHFRKQVAIDNLVFDFADYSSRLLIELDGGIHALPDVALRDEQKSQHALNAGFKLLRLTNKDVWERPDWVIGQVRHFLNAPHPPTPSPQGRGGEDTE
jgi:very-short-patch-repair endonuclease